MGQASVTIDINAQIKGYQASLNKLKSEANKIDLGSSIGKQISSALSDAESRLKSLMKNPTPTAKNDSQIDSTISKVNQLGESVQHVASLMQNVTVGDLNLSVLGESVQNIILQITTLKNQLNNIDNGSFQKMIGSSEELSTIFKNLNIDVAGKNNTQIFEELGEKAEEAARRVSKAEAQLTKAQANVAAKRQTLANLQKSPVNNRQQFQKELREMGEAYKSGMGNIKELVDEKVKSLLEGKNGSENSQKIIDAFFKDLTLDPGVLASKLSELQNSIREVLNTNGQQMSNREIYDAIFGSLVKADSPIAVNFAEQLLPALQQNISSTRQQIKNLIINKLSTTSDRFTSEQLGKILGLLDDGDIDNAINLMVERIKKVAPKVAGQLLKARQGLAQAEKKQAELREKLNTEKTTQSNVSQAESQLRAQVESLQRQIQQKNQLIRSLQQQLNQKKQGAVSDVRGSGVSAAQSAQQFQLGAEAGAHYKNQVQQVQQKEQLVGKIQGVVQRWFSIYAVVRAVGNAIREVTSTIKEIDSTITDIAIVTDKSQNDLWGQMDTYAGMAKQYAASISGVYKVSQLYYQQGLQTADVMALTQQTLKMARISGLDYATATDYMTNAIRSFKMQMTDAQTVVDVYSAVAASSASSVEQLSTAMSKTASSAQAVGSSFESTTAMMAVMIEATRQSAENIGSAMKSIISRYGEMTKNPASLVDAEGQEMSLNRVDTALQSVGISIHDAEGEFRSFSDVIMELAEKWETIDTNTQRYIATTMAGNRLSMLAVTWMAFIIILIKQRELRGLPQSSLNQAYIVI